MAEASTGSRRAFLAFAIFLVVTPVLLVDGASGKPVHRAGIVVQHGDLGVLTDCVKFSEHEIDGIELLARSEFDFRAARFPEGKGVCWLDGERRKTTDSDDCFCTPASGVLASWSYWVQEKEDPIFDHGEMYPSERKIMDGSIDYWAFGPHGMPPIAPHTLEEVCGS